MSKTPFTKLTTAGLNSILSTTVANLYPYQIRQLQDLLDRVNWGRANGNVGKGSDSDISNQPTMNQIYTLLSSNNP